jgi:hypothetical protein
VGAKNIPGHEARDNVLALNHTVRLSGFRGLSKRYNAADESCVNMRFLTSTNQSAQQLRLQTVLILPQKHRCRSKEEVSKLFLPA